ncbi:MAG: ATP-dependent RNA helicase RhlB [Gammaproteobacteria bacterium]|jgi:ATP-dependent RNA helicase RhlB|nr:ATP-dependent RNA helicase RhlB [Gammaproteobacteria bacterium]MBT4605851.1 ATP-dependent RNA helicase RhlB [Thiotrichales bacterium]MBT3471571.1 ATP-dependent RNA helicase RhlB [Gammaproteobacteria bacterium]MBT3967889.1 ATP-dependent RNA helicase RhlB [Gammaproteobacteria bacterium]MBT4081571.1 ATP-dependent RNA helicase RhlB [Gammaproteobacteria bacterium]
MSLEQENTDKQSHLSDTPFSSLELSPELARGVEACGFEFCTPIQADTLPLALQGKDIAGQAQTGTGKSAAFLLATMDRLIRHSPPGWKKLNQPRALILAPTRELAIQIHHDAEQLGRFTELKLGLAYGGTGYDSQRKAIEEGLDILIGTPGRIIDYFKQHVFDLKAAEVVVMDEADRMFDLGFIKDIRYLMNRCPKPEKRQSMLFSATLSFRVMELAYDQMNKPEEIKIEPEKVTAAKINEIIYYPANNEKIPLLIGLMKTLEPHRSIVFVNTKYEADKVWSFLEGNGYPAAVLSGDVPQKKRQQLLEKFQQGEVSVLVATDVAARGIHVPEVSHVFNYDLPQDCEDYVHRIGRTARAGASGDAVSLACEKYSFSLPEIETYIDHKIPVGSISNSLLAELKPPVKRPTRDRGGKPGNRKPNNGRHGKPHSGHRNGQRRR